MKISLSGLSLDEITKLIKEKVPDIRDFKMKQIHAWIYQKNSSNINKWSDISKEHQKILQEYFEIPHLKLDVETKSKTGYTDKYLFKTQDDLSIESVYMKFKDKRSSLCISTQIGCQMGCEFCATARLGFKRNLNAQEICDQIMTVQRIKKNPIDNIVFMGQGEPLNNFDELIKAIDIIRHSISIGARSITVSTVGIVPQIYKLAEQKLPINLAISLHFAKQDIREKFIPISKKYQLFDLLKSLKYYYQSTKRRITFEYTLIKGINDSREDALAFLDTINDLSFPYLVNLIPYNQISDRDFERSSYHQIALFQSIVERSNRKVTLRMTMGDDINAACGQLHNI